MQMSRSEKLTLGCKGTTARSHDLLFSHLAIQPLNDLDKRILCSYLQLVYCSYCTYDISWDLCFLLYIGIFVFLFSSFRIIQLYWYTFINTFLLFALGSFAKLHLVVSADSGQWQQNANPINPFSQAPKSGEKLSHKSAGFNINR